MEFLNESARKARRNLLLYAVISWALASGGIGPAPGVSTISIAGVGGFRVSLGFVFVSLIGLLIFNMTAFFIQARYSKLQRIKESFFQPAGHRNVKSAEVESRAASQVEVLEKVQLNIWEVWLPYIAGASGLAAMWLVWVRYFWHEG